MDKLRLTPNQEEALRQVKGVEFIVPPECGGQTVIYSYGCSYDYCYEQRYDRSDLTVKITAYKHSAAQLKKGVWDPWNGTPLLGRLVGVIRDGKRDE
jgi:hypothetical protein